MFLWFHHKAVDSLQPSLVSGKKHPLSLVNYCTKLSLWVLDYSNTSVNNTTEKCCHSTWPGFLLFDQTQEQKSGPPSLHEKHTVAAVKPWFHHWLQYKEIQPAHIPSNNFTLKAVHTWVVMKGISRNLTASSCNLTWLRRIINCRSGPVIWRLMFLPDL